MLKVKEMLTSSVINWRHFFVTRYCKKIQKIDENWWKLANIDREFLHIFWTTWANSMKLSGNMCLKIILKVTKSQGFTFSLESAFFEKSQGGVELTPEAPPPPPPSLLPLPSRLRVQVSGKLRIKVLATSFSFLLFSSLMDWTKIGMTF